MGLLPTVFESHEVTGSVSAAAAKATGLIEGTPVVAGAGDQAASAIGNGIVERAWFRARSEPRELFLLTRNHRHMTPKDASTRFVMPSEAHGISWE
jgi:ribulose kinase